MVDSPNKSNEERGASTSAAAGPSASRKMSKDPVAGLPKFINPEHLVRLHKRKEAVCKKLHINDEQFFGLKRAPGVKEAKSE